MSTRTGTILSGLVLAAALMAAPRRAEASHFRYGHVSWSASGASDAVFQVQTGWRPDVFPCVVATAPMPENGTDCSLFHASSATPLVGDLIVDRTVDEGTGHGFAFGDGSVLAPPIYAVTSVDPVNQWLFALALDASKLPTVETAVRHTYATSSFTAELSGCCRIATKDPIVHVNNSGLGFKVVATGRVGTGDASPVTALPPIVACPANAKCCFAIPEAHPEGDVVAMDLVSGVDAGDAAFKNPTGAIVGPDPKTGQWIYCWNTDKIADADQAKTVLYSTQVRIRDFAKANLAVEKSRVAVDFMIRLTSSPPAAPTFSSAPCGQELQVMGGRSVQFAVTAHGATTDVLTLNAVGVPMGATVSPALPATGGAGKDVSATVTWTPTDNQPQTFVANFVASNAGGGVAYCPVTIRHVACLTPEMCSDGVDCTDETCDEQGCHSAPNDARCSPLNDCTQATCSPGTGKKPSGCVQHERCCGNCTDDDQDGLVDAQDADCCSPALRGALLPQSAPYVRRRRHAGTTKVNVGVQVPEQLFQLNPGEETVHVVVSQGADALVCRDLPIAQFETLAHGGWRYRDGAGLRATIRPVLRFQHTNFRLTADATTGGARSRAAISVGLGEGGRCAFATQH